MVNFIKSLIGWAFKPKTIIIVLSLFLILYLTYPFLIWCHRNQVRKKAFSKVKISIDTSNFPLNYNDYLISQSKNKKKSRYYKRYNKEPKKLDLITNDKYCHRKECYLLLDKLIKKLATGKKDNNSIITPGLRYSYEFKAYFFYYNKFGELIYIQAKQGNPFGTPYVLYDKQGNLLQVQVMKGYNTYYFDNNKKLILYCEIGYSEDGSAPISCKSPKFPFL